MSPKNPEVYYKFKAKDKNSDEIIEYRVQDLPMELYDEAIELFLKNFLPDEILCNSRGCTDNPVDIQDAINFYKSTLR